MLYHNQLYFIKLNGLLQGSFYQRIKRLQINIQQLKNLNQNKLNLHNMPYKYVNKIYEYK